jgi:GxxExxY protein
MNANERESLESLIKDVIGAAYEVGNSLGGGFLEKVYERALLKELALRGWSVRQQVAHPVMYKGAIVGEYFADLLVEDAIVIELKCADHFAPEHIAQCINYLKASGLKIALLFNFKRSKVEWKRIVNNL